MMSNPIVVGRYLERRPNSDTELHREAAAHAVNALQRSYELRNGTIRHCCSERVCNQLRKMSRAAVMT